MNLTTFEHELAGKILYAIGDNTIGHTTKIANIIREEITKWNFKQVIPIDEEELDRLAVIEGAKAIEHFVNREQSKFAYEWADLVKDSYKAGYRKAKGE